MDRGCDGKRQSGSLAIASWNTALKVRYLFPHIPFKPFQRLHCYQNTSEVSLTCLHLSVISTSSLQFRFNTTSLFLSSLSGEQWPRSDQPLSPTQTPKDMTLRQHLHSGSRKQKYVGFDFFISKCFSLSPWRWMFNARWRSSAKHVNKLLTDKRSATSAVRDFLTFL